MPLHFKALLLIRKWTQLLKTSMQKSMVSTKPHKVLAEGMQRNKKLLGAPCSVEVWRSSENCSHGVSPSYIVAAVF